jgi:RNA polymerase sigma-70 factor (ECF subfamily)
VTEAATDDRGLVRRMRAGEEAAFEQFFEGHFSRLYRFALARLNQDADAAEDVVQVTLCKAVAGLKGYRFESALFTWLCAICRHEIAAHYEHQGRRPEPISLVEDSPEVRAALDSLAGTHEGDPERHMHRQDVARLVQVTLDALPSSYGDALEWKYVHGLSVKEIAARLNLGIKAAESLLTRAREAFRGGLSVVSKRRWSER